MTTLARMARWLVPVVAWGCSGSADDTAQAALPDADTGVAEDNPSDTGLLGGVDTGVTNDSPNDVLEVTYEGEWVLTPQDGPYRNMTGALEVREIRNGNEEEPWCTVSFALTGTVPEDEEDAGCSYCDVTLEVLHYLSEEGLFEKDGDPILDEDKKSDTYGEQLGLRENCMDPDVPADQDRWTLSFAEEDDTIFFDYYGTGVWVPWYEGSLVHDTLTFSYTAEVGFVEPEEDP